MTYIEQTKEASKAFNTRENSGKHGSRALTLSLISVSAALYAVAIAATSPVGTPLQIGHFRPGVVIPAFFAVVFGPLVGGVGAAIGCFIGDFTLSFFGLTTPLLSLLAGVPGNFVGFYLLGWLNSKRHTLSFFILNSFVSLVVGNLIAALGVLGYLWFIVPLWAPLPINTKIAMTMGLTIFWVVTMIVFVVPLVPFLILYVEPSLRRIGVRHISNLRWDKPINAMKSSSIAALILLGLYVLMTFVPGGNFLFIGIDPPELLILASVATFVSGLIFAFLSRNFEKSLSR